MKSKEKKQDELEKRIAAVNADPSITWQNENGRHGDRNSSTDENGPNWVHDNTPREMSEGDWDISPVGLEDWEMSYNPICPACQREKERIKRHKYLRKQVLSLAEQERQPLIDSARQWAERTKKMKPI